MILYQVNRLLYKQHFLKQFVRGTHKHSVAKVLYPLESRKLLKVSGKDAPVFLQGLITNDMRHFEESHNSMYAMFLNNKGRVLYDTLIHKWQGGDTFMLECDKDVLIFLQKHLKIYKLKRKVEIVDASNDFNLWALISPSETILESQGDSKINIYKDPRLLDLGNRILTSTSVEKDEIKEIVGKDTLIENSEKGYRYLRYKLGVSEGAEDLPPGTSFPLEANCDYLHGVSFHKGCYIGQELTARVHHTGIVRKRIMPLKFCEDVKDNLDKDSVISASNNAKSNVGKLKSYANDYGLGLVRIKEGLEANSLHIGKYTVEVVKPTWWPIEAPKEKATIDKDL